MDLDWTTVLFEVVNFGVLLALLTRFLFRPVRSTIALRQEQADIARRDVDTARAERLAAQEETRARERALREEAETVRREIAASAQTKAEALIEEARARVRTTRAAAEAELARARTAALREFRTEVVDLAVGATSHLLRSIGSPDLTLEFARRGAREMQGALPSGQTPMVVKAFASPGVDMDTVAHVLRDTLPGVQIEVTLDETIVGGVRLAADGLEVEASAGETVDRWFESRSRQGSTTTVVTGGTGR